MNIIIAGIGTDVGKTIVSAVLCEALNAHYWKPVQAGNLDNTDTHFVSGLLDGNEYFTAWPERYRLTEPMSPHAAADIDGVEITLDQLNFPQGCFQKSNTDQNLVIELAGGLMVPLSSTLSVIDLVSHLNSPVVLVANYYLGSINHTLLSIHLLKAKQTPILGIIFNGEPNVASRDVILKQSGVELLGEIPHDSVIDRSFIQTHAEKIRQHPAMAGI